MISAYSVVWEPVSAPDDGDAARVDNEVVLRGMATPSKEGGHEGGIQSGGQGAEGTGHRRDDGEQDDCQARPRDVE
jgi:hypothetical protein